MESPTAFYQEFAAAMAGIDSVTVAEDFSICVTETHDSENYRIQWQMGNSIMFWEGDDWPTVLAECVANQQVPF